MTKQHTRNYLLVSIAVLLLVPCPSFSQEEEPAPRHKRNNVTHLSVKVIAGEEPEAVSGAEVFVQPGDEDHPDGRTLRTDRKGVATFLRVPRAKVMIQVTAAGLKTFGDFYELTQENQTITITLKKKRDGGL